jgi:hypothetical protein
MSLQYVRPVQCAEAELLGVCDRVGGMARRAGRDATAHVLMLIPGLLLLL